MEQHPAPTLDVAGVTALRNAALDAARPDAVAQQHRRGRLTARERIDGFVDPGSFDEIAPLARPASRGGLMHGVDAPADGIVVGRARVDGRPVVVVSYDFTVLGGSMGSVNDEKFSRARHISLRHGVPLVMFLEGGGARIHERLGSTTIRGHERFSDLALLSGWAPILCAVVGPTFAGHANLAALADFTVMVEGSSLGLAGPRLVRAVTGEQIDVAQLSADFHARQVGSVELAVPTEQSAFEALRRYLALMPTNSNHAPDPLPYTATEERLDDRIASLVPDEPNRAYDMRRLVRAALDADSALELKPAFARNLITTLGRIGGRVVGVIANNPMFLAGALDRDASNKMARFVNLCDSFNIPIVVLCDTPGFLVGAVAEATNLVRYSMRPIWDFAQCTVPIITIVVRKAYGLAYHAMGGAEFHPQVMVCWPGARVSPMGAQGAGNVLMGARADRDAARDAAQVAEFADLESPLGAARAAKIDDIIDPRDTRLVILRALQFAPQQDFHTGHWRPPKKRAVSPI